MQPTPRIRLITGDIAIRKFVCVCVVEEFEVFFDLSNKHTYFTQAWLTTDRMGSVDGVSPDHVLKWGTFLGQDTTRNDHYYPNIDRRNFQKFSVRRRKSDSIRPHCEILFWRLCSVLEFIIALESIKSDQQS